MKEILKLMKFDFLTALPLAMPALVFSSVFLTLISLFFAPFICGLGIFVSMVLLIPLQMTAEKSGFNKLYGTIPVKRRSITRARFLYIFLVNFITEIICLAVCVISINLKLYRFMPLNENSLEWIQETFTYKSFWEEGLIIITGFYFTSCLIFTYMEMMGQIFGRDEEMKILLITLFVISGIAIGFFSLSDHNIIPTFEVHLPDTNAERTILCISMNVIIFVLDIIFGEITVKKLMNREL